MPEKISEVASKEQFKIDYTRYGIYILYRRVLSDYRDGLKPVQRRILWAMYKNTKAITSRVKSAAVVGDVMKLYHPHGDCLRANTPIYCLDNSIITIEQAYNMGLQKLDVLAVDENGKVVPAVATNFRIGQYTDKIYKIHLSNGYVVECTGNHPFLLSNMQWVKAEDITPNMRLYSKCMTIYQGNRPSIDGQLLQCLVHDFYYGTPPNGYERHHKDHNSFNNTPSNLISLTKHDHIYEHSIDNEAALNALEAGRNRMFGDTDIRDRIRQKNSILASEFNKDQGIRRFKHIIGIMQERNMPITEEAYESLRGTTYNMPYVSRLIERHPEYGKTFEDLVNYEPESLSTLFNNRASEIVYPEVEYKDLINPVEFYNSGKIGIYRVFDRLLESGLPISVEAYYASVHAGTKVTPEKLMCLINLYRVEKPYVDYVEIECVDNEPMYDFTVNGFENMLIPVKSMMNVNTENVLGFNMPFICVHNSAVYNTIKPMVNWFESYMPLIDPEGNFGTFQGDPCASSRYTEIKLTKFTIDNILGDIIESSEAVDWSDNYSGTTKEPDYLPVKVPLLLINGSFGIGVGMRADIPSHNINEVIDATLTLMDNPNAEITLVPDHCMECEIIETDFAKICRSGFGHYKVRGKIVEEEYKGKKALVIKSVPNLTFLNTITDKIEDLIKAKKIIQIDNCFDESTEFDMRYVIVLKNGSDPNYVKDVIYKNTNLEQTIRINFETLNGLNPLRLSYKAYLLSFIDFRMMTKFRVYSNKLQAIQTRIHEREAYIKVLESGEIDNIINMIKKQKTVDDSYLIEYLIKKLKITDLQASYIISADLKKLSYGYLMKYKQEAAELTAAKNELMKHIMDDNLIKEDIRQELLEAKRKYGKPRNCKIISLSETNEVPQGSMTVAITERNFIRKVPTGTNLGTFKNDVLKTTITLDNTDSILIFDEMGKVFKLPVHRIPFTDRNTNGIDIRFLIKSLTANISTIIPESVFKNLYDKGVHNNKHYIVTLTASGLIKRMDLDDFVTVPPSGILYAKIDKGDSIKDIVIAHSSFNLIVYSDRKAVTMPVNDIPYLKRNTKGYRAMSNVDHVDGMCVIYNGCTDIVVVTESGKANRISVINGLPNSGRGKSGCNIIKLGANDRIVGVVSGTNNDIVHIKCSDTDMTIPVQNLKIGSSISSGDKVITTRGNKILHCWIEKSK